MAGTRNINHCMQYCVLLFTALMVWPMLVACGNALLGRQRPRNDNENPLVTNQTSFETNILLPSGAPPPYIPPLVNNNSKPSPVYLRGSDEHDDEECPICLGSPSPVVAKANCGHWFHPECLFDWLDRSPHRSCPICEAAINTDIIVDDNN